MTSRSRPIKKFAAAVSRCHGEVSPSSHTPLRFNSDTNKASLYGKCIVTDYNSVHKDKCLREFMKLKDCYLVSLLHFVRYNIANNDMQAASRKA